MMRSQLRSKDLQVPAIRIDNWEVRLAVAGATRLALQHLFDGGKPYLELAHVPPEEDVLR